MTSKQKNTPNSDAMQRAEVVTGFRTIADDITSPGASPLLAMLAAASITAGFLDRGVHARINSEVMNEFSTPTAEALQKLATQLADSVERQEWLDISYGEKLAMELRMIVQSAALDDFAGTNETLDMAEGVMLEALGVENLSSYAEVEAILPNYSRDKAGLVSYLYAVADIIAAAGSKQLSKVA